MKTNLFKIMGFFSLLGIIVLACSKSDSSDLPSLTAEEIILAQDDLAADDIFNDVDGSVQDQIQELEANGFQTTTLKSDDDEYTCLVVTVDYPDSTRFPKVITLDYGTGCRVVYNGDTIFKEGKIIITLTDHFFNPGAQRIITFEDFYVNEMKVEGLLTNTYVGPDENGMNEYNLKIEDGKLIFADEDGNRLEYTREADFTKLWDRADWPVEDTVYLDGSMWGVTVEGLNYSREIVETLVMVHCPGYGRRWVIVDGIVVSTIGDSETTTDYSDGGCDGTAGIFPAGPMQRGPLHRIRIRMHHRYRHNGGNQ